MGAKELFAVLQLEVHKGFDFETLQVFDQSMLFGDRVSQEISLNLP